MLAQRDCLAAAAGQIQDLEGVVLELGLGNGRSYDHLRELLPQRDIYVFDRRVASHPDCVPEDRFLFLGEILETLPKANAQLGRGAVLAHCDFGSGRAGHDADVARQLALELTPLIVAGGVVVSDQQLASNQLKPMPLPDGVPLDRYFMYTAV